MALTKAGNAFMILGECVPCLKQGASKFKVKHLEMDPHIHMYFTNHEFIYAHDPQKLCKTGDLVLIEKLPKRLTRLITHQVKEVIFPLGDITDPVTGKKVIAGKYRDHIDKINQVYGEKSNAFKYEEAPPRGWQEDKKDFTHVQTYVKYHDTGKDEPYAV